VQPSRLDCFDGQGIQLRDDLVDIFPRSSARQCTYHQWTPRLPSSHSLMKLKSAQITHN